MLFVIGDSILQHLYGMNNIDDEEYIDFLTILAYSWKAGEHLVFASKDVLDFLSTWEPLGERVRAIYRKIRSELPQLKSYYDFFTVQIEVVSNDIAASRMSRGRVEVIRIPVQQFSNISGLQRTILLTENQQDAIFYKYIAQAYIAKRRVRVNLHYITRGGGGSTISDEYQEIQNAQNALCICLLDSDKKSPEHRNGNTAKGVEQVNDPDALLTDFFIIKARDVENLIPIPAIWEVIHGNSQELAATVIETIAKGEESDALLYLDMKKGLKLGEILLEPRSAFSTYWSQIYSLIRHLIVQQISCDDEPRCRSVNECDCIVVPPLGDHLLVQVNQYFEKLTAHKIAELVDNKLWPAWDEIGALVTAWGCAGHQRSAI